MATLDRVSLDVHLWSIDPLSEAYLANATRCTCDDYISDHISNCFNTRSGADLMINAPAFIVICLKVLERGLSDGGEVYGMKVEEVEV